MKPLFFLSFFILIILIGKTQSPQLIPYQSIIRNSTGNIVSNHPVKLRFSIHDSSSEGNIVFKEFHSVHTSMQGLVNVNIGQGTSQFGILNQINWNKNAKFIQIELDVNNNDTYLDLGTTQLLSVPYALYSNNGVSKGSQKGQMLYWDGDNWVTVGVGANGQNLTYCNGIPQWGPCPPSPPVINTNGGARKFYCYFLVHYDPSGDCFYQMDGGNVVNFLDPNGNPTNPCCSGYGVASIRPNWAKTTPDVILVGGDIYDTSTGSANPLEIYERGICYSLSHNPTILDSKIEEGNGFGGFTTQLNNLEPNTIYYFKAYVNSNAGLYYGQEESFNTDSISISNVTTTDVNQITDTSINVEASVFNYAEASVAERGICFSSNPHPTIADNHVPNGSGIGDFSIRINGLSPNSNYYIRSYIKNAIITPWNNNTLGYSYGNEIMITTLPSH